MSVKITALQRELDAWAAEGLISADQADAIRARYQRDAELETRGRVVSVLSAVGAIVAGLGVILFVGANWDELPRPTRVALLLGLLVASYAGAYVLRERRGDHPFVGDALYLLGGLTFAASLFLVGQMYHVDAHWPLAFLAIALGPGAVAAVVGSRPLATLSLVSFGAWPLAELLDVHGSDAVEYWPVAAALYGVALYGLGTADRGRLETLGFRAPMRALGPPLLAAGAFVFTFAGIYGELDDRPALDGRALVALAGLLVAAGAGAAALASRRESRRTAVWEAGALAALTLLVPLAVLVPEPASAGDGAIVYPLLFNALVALLALGAVVVGYVNEEAPLVTFGLVLVGVDVLARYLDVFWAFLPRSLAFVVAGVLLLALAWALERQRSRLVERLR